jgi:hypothetical protein
MADAVDDARLRRPVLIGAKGLRPLGASPDDDRPTKAGTLDIFSASLHPTTIAHRTDRNQIVDIIYTCTPLSGETGEPSRRIALSGVDHEQLLVAYLISRSDFFDDPDVPERNLVLFLQATDAAMRPAVLCELYEHYRDEQLGQFGDVDDLGSLDRAQWQLNTSVVAWSDAEVDAKIVEILRWHNDEIQRIASLVSELHRRQC